MLTITLAKPKLSFIRITLRALFNSLKSLCKCWLIICVMVVTKTEVGLHSSRNSCWVVVHGQVYDLTNFLDQHPGGASSILRYAGKDATKEYEPLHPPGTIDTLPKEAFMGSLEMTVQDDRETETVALPPPEKKDSELPPLSTLQNLDDFKLTAQRVLSEKAWVYYSSAADSLHSDTNNRADWARIHFRPRVLRRVDKVCTATKIMGHNSALPIFIAPAALARLGHEDGELCLGRGASKWNIPYCCSTYSSVSHADIAECMEAGTLERRALCFQLYVPIDKIEAKKLIHKARRLNCKALVLTVDSAVIGKREEDERYKARLDHEAGVQQSTTASSSASHSGLVPRGVHSSTLDWRDLTWIREAWGNAGPVVLKGIQSAEDTLLACRAGIDAVYLSNHGGRQLDFAPSSIKTLLEIRKFCPDIMRTIDIYLDGGVSRGSDVVKAICLGAKAVGLGRPFMYSLSGYGTDGVNRAIESEFLPRSDIQCLLISTLAVLDDEIQTTMRLLGVTDLSELSPSYVNAKVLINELSDDVHLPESMLSSKL